MSNNYGSGGYGNSAKGVGSAVGMTPIGGIVQLLVGKAAQNIGGSIDDSHRINQEVNTKGQGDINSEHQSPFGAMDEQGAQMFPGAEKMLSANTKPLEVAPAGFSVQSTNVDSSQSPFQNSSMKEYLNYMKYRGGY